jgi:anti-anti-sigma regulatory factor
MASNASTKKKKAPVKKGTKKTTASMPDIGTKDDKGRHVLKLAPVLVINDASYMHQKLFSYLVESDNEVVIDASLVEMIDTAMIQLLFSLVNGLKSKNVRIIWRRPSLEFVSRVRSLGLAEIFGIDIPVEG